MTDFQIEKAYMNVLETKELTKRFGGLVAVNEVSMHVAEGETLPE